MVISRWAGLGLFALALAVAAPARADDSGIVISIKGGKFEPAEVPVPAGQKVKLLVRNADATMSEFESHEFHREKVVPPGGEVVVYVGPLDAGRYEFFDDFHPENRGHLVVK
jgi:plastocyanin